MGIDVMGIGTVVIHVSDVERSRHFYAEMLGLPVVSESDDAVALGLGDDAGLLLRSSDSNDIRARHGRIELQLRVADVYGAIAFLRERATPVLQEPTDDVSGDRRAAVLDPDGYPVFLIEAQMRDHEARAMRATPSEPPLDNPSVPTKVIVDSVEGGRVTVEGHASVVDVGAIVTSGAAEVIEAGDAVVVRAVEDVEVRVANGVQLCVRAGNHVTVGGIDGAVDLSMSEGHVRVRDCRGGLKINTGDGHVTLEDIHGPIDITTGDGHVKGTGVHGAVRIRTGDGHVRLSGRVQDANVDTGDGEIAIMGGSGRCRLQTGDGDVRADGLFTDVTVTTGEGEVTIERCDGRAHIETGEGDVHLAGRVSGDSRVITGDGTVRLQLSVDSNVDIRAKAERVTNRMPPQTGANGRLVIRASEIVVLPAGDDAAPASRGWSMSSS